MIDRLILADLDIKSDSLLFAHVLQKIDLDRWTDEQMDNEVIL